MTQDELATRVGIAQTAISTYETGSAQMKEKTIIALAAELQCSTDYLIGVVDDPAPYYESSDLTSEERLIIGALRAGDKLQAVHILTRPDDVA